jgi:hypothetical protein
MMTPANLTPEKPDSTTPIIIEMLKSIKVMTKLFELNF